MTPNIIFILIATVVQFVINALWYSALFGKPWLRIMGNDKLSKEELTVLEKSMIPFYGIQFVITLLFTFALASHLLLLPAVSPFEIAFWVWLGYIVPIQISAVIWGKTHKKFWLTQIAIMASSQLVSIMLAAYILTSF